MIRNISKTFIVIYFLLSACSKPFDVEYPFEGDRFVMYTTLDSDEVIQVKLDKTYPPTGKVEFEYGFLKETVVTLYENGVLIDTLKRVNTSFFQSTKRTKPTIGSYYSIKAEAPDFLSAISEDELLLPKVEIAEISVDDRKVPSPLNPDTPAHVVRIKLKSIPKNVAYIEFNLTGKFNDIATSANVSSPIYSNDIDNPCVVQVRNDYLFKSDCIKEGQEIVFLVESMGTLQIFQPGFYPTGPDTVNNIDVEINTVNQSYFDFHTNFFQENGLFAALEGINATVTNVKNGYGAILCRNGNQINIKID